MTLNDHPVLDATLRLGLAFLLVRLRASGQQSADKKACPTSSRRIAAVRGRGDMQHGRRSAG